MLVKITDHKFIPFLSCMGPIMTPVNVSEKHLQVLDVLNIAYERAEVVASPIAEFPANDENPKTEEILPVTDPAAGIVEKAIEAVQDIAEKAIEMAEHSVDESLRDVADAVNAAEQAAEIAIETAAREIEDPEEINLDLDLDLDVEPAAETPSAKKNNKKNK